MLRAAISLFNRHLVFKRNQLTINSISAAPLKSSSAKSSTMSSDRLVWVDLETHTHITHVAGDGFCFTVQMTGLDVDTETILEMACIVTDGNLNVIAEGPDIIVHQPNSVLDGMGEWCQEQHGKSGLTAACRSSTTSLEETEQRMLAFMQSHTTQGKCVLAGNTIHMDRRFLDKYMPRFTAHLHYRLVDVSTVKELCRRWYPADFERAPAKKCTHRALDDIKESIEELKYYKTVIFK